MKKKITRILSLFLALMMVIGLAACGAKEEPSAAPAEKPTEETKAPAAEKTEELAETPREETAEAIPLKWYLAGNGPQADQETVSNAMEAYILENYGLNFDLELVVSDFGSYSDKAQMVIASGEEYDIMWTSSWCNDYYTNVGKNAFISLDDLLAEYGKELTSVIPEGLWNACRVEGELYAVPSYQISASQNVVSIPVRYVEEFNLDVNSIQSLADLNDFFYAVKEAYPDVYPLAVENVKTFFNTPHDDGYEALINFKVPGAVELDSNELKVVNQFELPAIVEKYDLFYRWCQDGIIRMDAAAVQDITPDLQAGMHAAKLDTSWKPYFEVDQQSLFGEEVVCILISDAYSSTGNAIATMNAISNTSKNPEAAMQFLNILNTDAGLYNLLCFGIEGTHYTINADGTATSNDAAGYNPGVDWVFGCQFNAIPREGQQLDIWEKTRDFSNSAIASPVIGFTFDASSVANEIAACTTVFDQYIAPLACGATEPSAALAEAMAKLEAAGYQAIINELQAQLDAWAATK